jgi:hypothetical protein
MDHDEECLVCKKYTEESRAAWRMDRHNKLIGDLMPDPKAAEE